MDELFDDADFDRLRTDQTAWFTLFEIHIRGNPKPLELEVRYIGEGNSAVDRLRNTLAFKELTKADEDAANRDLIAKCAIVSWRNFLDANGNEVPYSPALGLKLFAQLDRVGRIERLVNRQLWIYVNTAALFTTPFVEAGDLGKE